MSNRKVPSRLYGDYPAQLAHFTAEAAADQCWHWTGYVLPNGYGQMGQNQAPHRLAWQLANGPIPDGLVIDHTCHNRDPACPGGDSCLHRRCVNPRHLEPVTIGTNTLRGHTFAAANALVTHCPQGHEYTAGNTYYRPDRIGRQCRECRYAAGVKFAEANRELCAARLRDLRRRQNPDDFAIRDWARANGLKCAAHGPISQAVRNAYEVSHQRSKAA